MLDEKKSSAAAAAAAGGLDLPCLLPCYTRESSTSSSTSSLLLLLLNFFTSSNSTKLDYSYNDTKKEMPVGFRSSGASPS
jgi:hypothetical protein